MFTLKQKNKGRTPPPEHYIRDSNHGRRRHGDSDLPATPIYFLYQYTEIGTSKYVSIRKRDAWDMLLKEKQHPPPGDDASTAEAAQGIIGETSKVRHVEHTPH